MPAGAAPFALYVHVPWCRHVCPYCDFNVYASAEPPEDTYVEALGREIAAWGARPPWQGRALRSVYLGGGTPSLLSPDAVVRVLAAADAAFGLVPAAEVTIEANPGGLTATRLGGYRAAGVTRVSLGAQSFTAAHLRTLGRDHSVEDIGAAVAAVRDAGFDNLSLDLIFGVPGESLADWRADLAAALALAPPHVSAYSLTYEESTPFFAWRARGRLAPVAEDDEAAMAELAVDMLEAAGLARYEISSFARPGYESRHNLAYWDGSDYLGIGAGAHSFAATPSPGQRFANERLPARYVAAVSATGTAVASEERLTEAQARAEFCFTGLRQVAGVDTAAFERRFGCALEAAFPFVARLIADDLVQRAGGRLRLTARGLRFADEVAGRFA
jgi:oxygen-independent coproporphyrinogen III oxidase